MEISVIIPTKNRHESLLRAIGSIAAQTRLAKEIIVVDQSSDPADWPRKIAASLPSSVGLEYIWDPAITGSAQARNVAIEKARSAILLFIDDDVTLRGDFISQLMMTWDETPDADGISGCPDNYSPPGKFYLWWSRIFLRGPFHDDRQPVYWNMYRLNRPVRVSRLSGGMMSIRKSSIGKVRFDENLHGVCDGEDVDFCTRMGGHLYIDPRCRLTHHFDSVGRDPQHWTSRECRSNFYLYRKSWPSHRIAFAWLMAGYLFAATIGCARRLSLGPMRSLLAACQS